MDMNDLMLTLKKESDLFKNHDVQLASIGDGNINKVYRAITDDGRTYVVKQARKTANISDDIKLNLSRGQLESAAAGGQGTQGQLCQWRHPEQMGHGI